MTPDPEESKLPLLKQPRAGPAEREGATTNANFSKSAHCSTETNSMHLKYKMCSTTGESCSVCLSRFKLIISGKSSPRCTLSLLTSFSSNTMCSSGASRGITKFGKKSSRLWYSSSGSSSYCSTCAIKRGAAVHRLTRCFNRC